ncbi:50S ribosomal protein L11 methyltransferase [Chitinophaga defluvii]|uniref:Ribosomal protein L11 methyltransferase n=1 Tax=Chitinophaga defluvii TaxID=3163343 RepID=A0ABV2SZM4_9BACT
MSYIAITIATRPELTDMLVAQLSEAGFEGFEEQTTALVAYIPEQDFNEAALLEILQQHEVSFTRETIAKTNWNAVWESNFQPVQVGDFCGIRADFHPPFTPAPTYEIVITPKMSFGTGHHATTFCMIQLMQALDFKDKQVFDFGTGTGILAILAEKLGAAQVDAIDIDEWAVTNTEENITANQGKLVKVWQADSLEAVKDTYNIVLANINRNILLAFMGDMRRLLLPGGILLLSGIMPADEAAILASAQAQGFDLQTKLDKDNWLAMQFIAG